jgi:hypothetical protein
VCKQTRTKDLYLDLDYLISGKEEKIWNKHFEKFHRAVSGLFFEIALEISISSAHANKSTFFVYSLL